MFGIGNRSSSERALVPVTDPIHDDTTSGDDHYEDGPAASSYSELLQFVRRRKCLIAFIATGVLLFAALMIATICVTAASGPVINPTTPAPATTTTSTPSTTTTSTTPSTTTTSTTPKTTTTSTTPKTTTTSATTTTTPKPSPPVPVPTTHPIPQNASTLAPITLLTQIGLTLNFVDVPCMKDPHEHETFRVILMIKQDPSTGRNFTGNSDTKKHAKTEAAKIAVKELLGIESEVIVPAPPRECVPVVTPLPEPETHISDKSNED